MIRPSYLADKLASKPKVWLARNCLSTKGPAWVLTVSGILAGAGLWKCGQNAFQAPSARRDGKNQFPRSSKKNPR